jgi:energy-converting hydrogenase A subunit F
VIGRILNSLAEPEQVPKIFAAAIIIVLIFSLTMTFDLNPQQLYPKPAPQVQLELAKANIDISYNLAPYNRGGLPLDPNNKGIVKSQYQTPYEGYITAYLTPFSQYLRDISYHFGTTILAHPGGILDEVLYYTRGYDTILESTILFTAFIIASWVILNITEKEREKKKK